MQIRLQFELFFSKKKFLLPPKCQNIFLELVTSLNKSLHHPKITKWTHPGESICKISPRRKISRLMLQVSFLKLCNIRQVISQTCQHCFFNFFGGLFNEKHAMFCFKLKSYSRQFCIGRKNVII